MPQDSGACCSTRYELRPTATRSRRGRNCSQAPSRGVRPGPGRPDPSHLPGQGRSWARRVGGDVRLADRRRGDTDASVDRPVRRVGSGQEHFHGLSAATSKTVGQPGYVHDVVQIGFDAWHSGRQPVGEHRHETFHAPRGSSHHPRIGQSPSRSGRPSSARRSLTVLSRPGNWTPASSRRGGKASSWPRQASKSRKNRSPHGSCWALRSSHPSWTSVAAPRHRRPGGPGRDARRGN